MDHPLPEDCADADGYVFPGGEQGGGIQRIDPEPELAEIEGCGPHPDPLPILGEGEDSRCFQSR
jgi:hypothetical protein